MSFPTTPTNGQQVVLNNVTYQYISTLTAWTRVLNFAGFASSATNVTGGSTGSVLAQQAEGVTGFVPPGATGTFLVSAGAGGLPYFASSLTTLVVSSNTTIGGDLRVSGNLYATISGVASSATNVSGGTTGSIVYQIGTNISGFIGIGSTGSFLVSQGTSATFVSTLTSLTLGATTATSTTTGALVVGGGVGIGGSVYIGGDLYVDGTQFTVNSTNIVTNDKTIYLSSGSTTAAMATGSGILVGSTASPFISWVFDGASNWQTNGGIKVNRVNFISTSSSTTFCYQVFNPATNSLDTILGP